MFRLAQAKAVSLTVVLLSVVLAVSLLSLGLKLAEKPVTETILLTTTERATETSTVIATVPKEFTTTSVLTSTKLAVETVTQKELTTIVAPPTTETLTSTRYETVTTTTTLAPAPVTVTVTAYVSPAMVTRTVTVEVTRTITTTITAPPSVVALEINKNIYIPPGSSVTLSYRTPYSGYLALSFKATEGVYISVVSAAGSIRYPAAGSATEGAFLFYVTPNTTTFVGIFNTAQSSTGVTINIYYYYY